MNIRRHLPNFNWMLVTVVAMMLVAQRDLAQVANNTALVGNVVDPSGRPVGNARVSAVNIDTRVVLRAPTNSDGYYAIAFILPGKYDITVEADGFEKLTKTGQIVAMNESRRTDFDLRVGSTTESVSVTAGSPPISTDDATLGETFDTKTVEDLPLIGHNALEAAATASNVMIGPTSSYLGVPPGEDFIGAGQREIQNSLNLDGVTIMNSLISLAPARPSTDMISEVQMQSGNYSAQYGSYLGLHVNLVSKSGTDHFHGALYDYVQNTALNARQFVDPVGTPTEVQHYNQYGFDVGGPVYIPKLYNGRNKTFFFASWEKLSQIQELSSLLSTLTPAMMKGDFSMVNQQLYDPYTNQPYSGNQIPANELNTAAAQVSQKLEAYFVAPNYPTVANPAVVNNLFTHYPNNLYITQTLDRIDENIGEHVRLLFRYHWQNLTYLAGSPFPANNSYGPTNTRNSAFGYTHILTPKLINDFRIGLNTVLSNNLDYWAQKGLNDAGTQLGIPAFNSDTQYKNPGIPSIYFDTYGPGQELGNTGANWYQGDRALDGYDQISWVHGKHNIMAGIELRRMTINREAANDSRGAFTFSGQGPDDSGNHFSTGLDAADFVLGLANNSQTPILPTNGSVAEWRDGFFALDNWRPIEKLTLNYGLRYELPTVPYSLNGYARIMNADETALIPASSATVAADYTPARGLKFNNPNHSNWAPRIGFDYRIANNTVIRGGFGAYYNANQLNTYTLTTQNYPLAATVNYNTASGSADLLSFSNPTPGSAAASPVAGVPGTYVNSIAINPYLPTQTLYQWNLSVGEGLWRNAGMELQYLGSHGLHLDRDFFDNTPAPGPGSIKLRRPNQLFGRIRRIQNDVYSHYNGFTGILRQRETHGISAMLSYTWSHNLDISDNSNSGVGNTMNQYDVALDYASSNWDIRHRFVGTATYDLPAFRSRNILTRETLGGWQANAIVTLQTGEPYNVNLSFDNANISQPRGQTQRPSWVHRATAHCSLKNFISGNATSCIDTTAFAIPAPYTFGTSHRNPLYGPGYTNVNFSVFKSFAIRESVKFQFRAEASNLFNHPSAGNPNATIDQGYDPNDPGNDASSLNFGTVTGTSAFYNPRYLQLSGKLIF
jgi:hypothetical protein